MNERLKLLRKTLGITQQQLADRIDIKRNTLATYESGRNEPIDAVISLICKTNWNGQYVNKEWLVNGEGEMFIEQSRDEDYTDIIQVLTSLDEDDWQLLLHTAFILADKKVVMKK